jgi:hypothetical protein
MELSAVRCSVHLFDGVRLEARAFEHRGERLAVLSVGPIGQLDVIGSAGLMREFGRRALAAAERADALPQPRPEPEPELEPVGVAA